MSGPVRWLSRKQKLRLREKLWNMQAGLCHLCGAEMQRECDGRDTRALATFDHLTPVSQEGGDEESNLRLAHGGCNSIRGDRGITGVPLAMRNHV